MRGRCIQGARPISRRKLKKLRERRKKKALKRLDLDLAAEGEEVDEEDEDFSAEEAYLDSEEDSDNLNALEEPLEDLGLGIAM